MNCQRQKGFWVQKVFKILPVGIGGLVGAGRAVGTSHCGYVSMWTIVGADPRFRVRTRGRGDYGREGSWKILRQLCRIMTRQYVVTF